MSFHLIPGGGGNELGSEDPFQIAFAPAKPVLDAVIEMLEPLRWLDDQRRRSRRLFEPERAAELVNIIPHGGSLAKAGALFLEAEEIPAPEGWLHVAIGLMLQSEGATMLLDGDAFRCAVADGAYRDPQVWEHYQPGFSPAVVVRAIREARLQGAYSPGGLLKLCIKHRRQFRILNSDMDDLLHLRWEVEDALEEIGKPLLLDYDPEDDVPFQ
jgi:hypothetical protein